MNILELTGPWQHGMKRTPEGLTYGADNIYAQNGDCIAHVYGLPINVPLEQIDKQQHSQLIGYARVLAAAPELQASLTELLADIEQWARDFGYADHGARRRAGELLERIKAE